MLGKATYKGGTKFDTVAPHVRVTALAETSMGGSRTGGHYADLSWLFISVSLRLRMLGAFAAFDAVVCVSIRKTIRPLNITPAIAGLSVNPGKSWKMEVDSCV